MRGLVVFVLVSLLSRSLSEVSFACLALLCHKISIKAASLLSSLHKLWRAGKGELRMDGMGRGGRGVEGNNAPRRRVNQF